MPHEIGFSNYFLYMTQEAQAKIVKIDKLAYIKIKSFCAPKDTMNRVKRQPTEWEKYLQIYI